LKKNERYRVDDLHIYGDVFLIAPGIQVIYLLFLWFHVPWSMLIYQSLQLQRKVLGARGEGIAGKPGEAGALGGEIGTP